jgi:hypothetical protein
MAKGRRAGAEVGVATSSSSSAAAALMGLGRVESLADTAGMGAYRAALETLGSEAAGRVGARSQWTARLRDGRGVRKEVLVTPPAYSPLDAEVRNAQTAVRDALTRASILEHRALMSADDADIERFRRVLEDVDDALARLWALEAWGALRKRAHVQLVRAQLGARIDVLVATRASAAKARKADGGLVRAIAEARGVHAALADVFAPRDNALRIVTRGPNLGDPVPAAAAAAAAAAAVKSGGGGDGDGIAETTVHNLDFAQRVAWVLKHLNPSTTTP